MKPAKVCPAEKVAGRDQLARALAARGVIPIFTRRFNANYDFEDDEPAATEDYFLGMERRTPFGYEEILITKDKISHDLRFRPFDNSYAPTDTYEAPHIAGPAGLSLDPAAAATIADRCARHAAHVALMTGMLEPMTWNGALTLCDGDAQRAIALARAALRHALRNRFTCNEPYSPHDLADFIAPHLALLRDNPHVRIADTLDDPLPDGLTPLHVTMSVHRTLEAVGFAPSLSGYTVAPCDRGTRIDTKVDAETFADLYQKIADAGRHMAAIGAVFYEGFSHSAGAPVELHYGT
jgi:hypothetical protein